MKSLRVIKMLRTASRSQSEYRVVGIFRHLYIQAKLLGQDAPCTEWPASLLPQSNCIGGFFESVHHARQTLEFLFVRAFNHIDCSTTTNHQHTAMSNARTTCETHLRIDSDLSTWFQAHHESTKERPTHLSAAHRSCSLQGSRCLARPPYLRHIAGS